MSAPKIRTQGSGTSREDGVIVSPPLLGTGEAMEKSPLEPVCVGNVLLQGHMSPVTPGDRASPLPPCARGGTARICFPRAWGHRALPCCRGHCWQAEMPSGCQRCRDTREGRNGMGTNRTAQPPRLFTSPAPFERSFGGILGIYQQPLGVHVMFPGPGNIHSQVL